MRGHIYGSVGGKSIPNEGEQYIPLQTLDGWKAGQVYQVAEVRRPLCSMAKLCDSGNRVSFGRGGGIVQNMRNGHCTPFRREGSIYVMDFYVDLDAPFRGPGERRGIIPTRFLTIPRGALRTSKRMESL